MTTVQGNLIRYDGKKVAPNTLSSAVYDEAKNQALSATLRDTPDKGVLGFPAFVTTDNYAPGDVVFYSNKLWRFTSSHAAGAWNANDVEEYALKDLVSDLQENLENGGVVPKVAGNLESWDEMDALSVEDTWSDPVRTTAGDTSIISDAGAKVVSIVPITNFFASALKTSGFNLLRGATAVGDGFYFLVPALAFGTYGAALKPNGVLFTDSNGNNLKPTVRFKPLASGVPTSVSDGSACAYTDSNGLRFFTTDQIGYLIVSGITLASTCAHIGWSRRYDEYIAVDAAGDAGSSITLSSIIHALHSYDLMLVAQTVSDRIDFGASAATWTRRVERVAPTWTTVENEDGSYTHSAVISGMKSDGEARCPGVVLSIDGTTVSYTSASATPTDAYVFYELATPATGTASISPSLAIEDWGLEYLVGATGSAYVTTQYAQGYPDSVAALAAGKIYQKFQVVAEALVATVARLEALERMLFRFGDVKAASVDAEELRCFGAPAVLYAAGAPNASIIPANWPANLPWDGVPVFKGQLYINTSASSGGLYYAKNNTVVSDWVNA